MHVGISNRDLLIRCVGGMGHTVIGGLQDIILSYARLSLTSTFFDILIGSSCITSLPIAWKLASVRDTLNTFGLFVYKNTPPK